MSNIQPPQDVIITARRWRGQCVYTLRDRCTLGAELSFLPMEFFTKGCLCCSASEQLILLWTAGSFTGRAAGWGLCVILCSSLLMRMTWERLSVLLRHKHFQTKMSPVWFITFFITFFLFCAQSPFPEKRWDTILAGLQARAVNGSLYTVECGKVKLFKIYTVYWTIFLLENVLVCTIILYFRFCKLIQFNELLYTWWYWNCDFKPKVCT